MYTQEFGDDMLKMNVKEARSKFSSLLNKVQQGLEIEIFRRGKKVARLSPLKNKPQKAPSLKNFRASLQTKGLSLSKTVIKMRTEERY